MILPVKDDNPTRRLSVLTVGIILANFAVHLYLLSLGSLGSQVFTHQLGVIPFEIAHGADAISPTPIPLYLTFGTSMFMHGGWMHLGANMLYLWIFGNNIEDFLGSVRFLGFYLFCGVVAILAHVILHLDSTIPLVGASGAVAGLLGAYVAAFPRARVHVILIFRVIEAPAIFVLGAWFLIQILNAATDPGSAGGVAWYAHIAGFVVGYLIVRRRVDRVRRRFGIN